MTRSNQAWNLEEFVDALVLELDKAQDTLAVKGHAGTRKLSYSVKDVALDLNIFPSYDGNEVRFTTAQPGEAGASKISMQLGSISENLIKETTKKPISRDDVSIEAIEGIDDDTKRSLQKIGINSARDIEKIERKNVDLEKVSKNKISFKGLADLINKARRRKLAPTVKKVSVAKSANKAELLVQGENLMLASSFEAFPIALLNNAKAEVLSASEHELRLRVDEANLLNTSNELKVALDPFAVFRLELR